MFTVLESYPEGFPRMTPMRHRCRDLEEVRNLMRGLSLAAATIDGEDPTFQVIEDGTKRVVPTSEIFAKQIARKKANRAQDRRIDEALKHGFKTNRPPYE